MKRLIRKRLIFTLVLSVSILPVLAQLNCDGITNMYGMFNRKTDPSGPQTRSTFIASISYLTGGIGPALGGQFVMPWTSANTGDNYYGSTSLSADVNTNRFFYFNRDNDAKGIYTRTTLGGTVQIGLTPPGLDNNWFVKLATGIDGFNYSLNTRTRTGGEPYYPMAIRMIRFNSCNTLNCTTIEEMGSLQISANLFNYRQYNGDLAFSASGDMYIFSSEIDTATFNYTWSRIYRVNVADIPIIPNAGNIIPVQYIGTISGLGSVAGDDTLAISGIAFDGIGRFYLSAVDEASGTRSYLFRGATIGPVSTVTQIASFGPVATGFTLNDLASCVYPNLVILPDKKFALKGQKSGNNEVSLSWEDNMDVNVKSYVVERQLEKGSYVPIGTLDAGEKGSDNFFRFTDALLPYDFSMANYRIRSQLINGSYALSNTIAITGNLNKSLHVMKNPFQNSLELEINAEKTGTMNIELLQEAGNTVYRKAVQVKRGKNIIMLNDLSNLKRGLYFVRVGNDETTLTSKVIKQ
jgi:hypothetical protein